jgi:hypothetical protein
MSSPFHDNKTSTFHTNRTSSADTNNSPFAHTSQVGSASSSRAPFGFRSRFFNAREFIPASMQVPGHRAVGQEGSEAGGIQLPSSVTMGTPLSWTSNRRVPFGSAIPGAISGRGKKPVGIIGQGRASGSTLDIVMPRKLLAAPLRLLRSSLVGDPKNTAALMFLSQICPVGGELATEHDKLIPSIIYSVTFPMAESQFIIYQQMILQCPVANEVQKILAVGGAEFDKVNDGMSTRELFVAGKDLEQMLREQVAQHRLAFTWDLAKNWNDPYRAIN